MIWHLALPQATNPLSGNQQTALRWRKLLMNLGHSVRISQGDDLNKAAQCDGLIALHARKSAAIIAQFRQVYGHRPIILALTGTDLYLDGPQQEQVAMSLQLADRIVVLHANAHEHLPPLSHAKQVIIPQSATIPAHAPRPVKSILRLSLLSHLRDVKNPLLPVQALHLLPPDLKLEIVHMGTALDAAIANEALQWQQKEKRYRYLGSVSHGRALDGLSRSHALLLPSFIDGPANVLSEAVVRGIPILASRIPANVGALGKDYQGLFNPHDAQELAFLLRRSLLENSFLDTLRGQIELIRYQYHPLEEQLHWQKMIEGLFA